MKLRVILCVIITSISLIACNGEGEQEFIKGAAFAEPRTYEHDLSSTNEQCLSGQPTRFNCKPSLFFAPDGTGTAIFTDIANAITYKINRSTLTTSLKGAGDIPKTLKFDISADGKTLLQVDNGVIWQLRVDQTDIAVFINKGEKQCVEGSGLSLEQSAAALVAVGVEVEQSLCGYKSGVVFPAVCGAGTAAVNIHHIQLEDLAAAKTAGFLDLAAFNEANPETKVVASACK